MTTKKSEKTASKEQSGESHEEPQSGRVHTIAKARPTPLTSTPKDKPTAVTVGDEPATGTTAKAPKKAKDPTANVPTVHKTDEIVVFAFRMFRSERDELHAATGSARASRFVRAIVLAGARGDVKAVQELIDEVQASRK